VDFGRREFQFIGEGKAGRNDARDDVFELPVVVEELQQGLAASTMPADAEQILAGGIDTDDQQVPIENDRTRIQVVDDVPRQPSGPAGRRAAAADQFGFAIDVCCT
jgi:hypothetical protein